MSRLGIAERAVYEILRRGALNEGEASLYLRQVSALVKAGVARRREDGGVELVNAGSYAGVTPSSVPPPASASIPAPTSVMPTLTARVPQEALDYLDSLGHASRSDALRAALAKLASQASGQRRKVGS